MLKSYRYATQNFGAAVAAKICRDTVMWEDRGFSPWEAQEEAFKGVAYDFINGANEDRVEEFFAEMEPSLRQRLQDRWLENIKLGGDAMDVVRDNEAVDRQK